jgi:leader peptidase (prepilin peptidase)/N-methyltransferase
VIVQPAFVFVKSVRYNLAQHSSVGYSVVVLYAVLGFLAGAFLNLAADNLPRRRRILSRPSCSFCRRERSWLELSWIISLLLGRERCPGCGARRSVRWLVLESLTVLSFVFFWLRYGLSVQLFLVTLYACALYLVFVIDLEHRLILRVVILPAIALAIVGSQFYPGLGWRRALVGGALAFLFFYLVVIVGRVAFGRSAMGRGDANLAAFVGLITGFPEVILTLLITVCLGGIVSLVLVASGTKRLRSYIPYGVFLVAGGLAMLVFHDEILAWYLGLF